MSSPVTAKKKRLSAATAASFAFLASTSGSHYLGGEGLVVEKPSDTGIYSPVGKRDPFKPPGGDASGRELSSINPLQKYGLEQLQLRAILKSKKQARALLEDPDGKTYIIHEGDVIAREHSTVSRILNTEVIVTEKTYNYLGVETLFEKVLSLPQGPEQGLDFTDAGDEGGSGKPANGLRGLAGNKDLDLTKAFSNHPPEMPSNLSLPAPVPTPPPAAAPATPSAPAAAAVSPNLTSPNVANALPKAAGGGGSTLSTSPTAPTLPSTSNIGAAPNPFPGDAGN